MNLITITATGLLAVSAPVVAPWLTQDAASTSSSATSSATTAKDPLTAAGTEQDSRVALESLRSAMAPSTGGDGASVATLDPFVSTSAAQMTGLRAALSGNAATAFAPLALDDEEAARREAEALQARIAELQAQIARLEAANASSADEEAVATREFERRRATEARVQSDAARARRFDLENRANDIDVRIARVGDERAVLDLRAVELETALDALGNTSGRTRQVLLGELETVQGERSRLDDESSALEAQYYDLLMALGEGENLHAFFVNAEAAAENADRRRAQRPDEDARFELEIERAQREVERAQREIERETRDLERERARVERQISRAQERIELATKNGKDGDFLADLEMQILDLHDELGDLDDERGDLDDLRFDLDLDMDAFDMGDFDVRFFEAIGDGDAQPFFARFGDDDCEDCEECDSCETCEDADVFFHELDTNGGRVLWLDSDGDGEKDEKIEHLIQRFVGEEHDADVGVEHHFRKLIAEFPEGTYHFDTPFPAAPAPRPDFEARRIGLDFPGTGTRVTGQQRFPSSNGGALPSINAGGDVNITNGGGGRDEQIIELLREIRDEVRGLRSDLRSMHGSNESANPRPSRRSIGMPSTGGSLVPAIAPVPAHPFAPSTVAPVPPVAPVPSVPPSTGGRANRETALTELPILETVEYEIPAPRRQ